MSAGGGSASVNPPHVVTPLAGITRRAGSGVSVRYAPGPSTDGSLPAVQSQSLIPPSGRGHGLHGSYWANMTMSGPPALVRTDPNVNFTFYTQSPGPGIPARRWSAEWTGSINAPAAGTYQFSLRSDGGSHLYIDNRLAIDDRGDRAPATATGRISLSAGSHAVKVDYHQDGGGSLSLGWQPANAPTPLQQATKLAASSDVAVVFASDFESEFVDRGSLELPGSQDQLIAAIARANPHTVVVLNTGDPVLMPWIGAVPGLIEAWYPGQEDGNAIAAVLFGDVNPSGKLPVTFPASQSDLPTDTPQQWPGSNGKVLYSRGLDVGYRWYDAEHITPLFPFGYGLSYTAFSFANLDLAGPTSSAQPVTRLTINGADELAAENAAAARAAIQDTGTSPTPSQDTKANPAAARTPRIRLSFHLTNTGTRGGADVAQIYLALPASTGEPPKRLVGFQRVDLAPGQTQRVTVTLKPADHPLAYWDTGTHSWQIAKGVYHLYVGDSSRNLRLTGSLLVV